MGMAFLNVKSCAVNGDSLNFDTVINSPHPVFIMFYSSSCIHCLHAKPEFLEAARYASGTPFRFMGINCEVRPDVARSAHIAAFPTFRLYQSGDYKAYEGPRSSQGFITFLS